MKSKVKKALKNRKGSAVVEAAVVFPIIFLCAIGLINTSSHIFTQARQDIAGRFEIAWKIEKETDWIRNGELLNGQIHSQIHR